MKDQKLFKTKEELKALFHKNKVLLINELNESKELIQLLIKSSHTRLSEEEWKKVKNQLLDIFKGIPAFAIFMLPGGMILLPIAIKLIPELLPSSFREPKVKVTFTYIAFLRAVNVAGKNKIIMRDLKEKLSPYLEDVQTYIQSGNIIFRSHKTAYELEDVITVLILKHFELEVTTIVKSVTDWQQIITNNPLTVNPTLDFKNQYITLFKTSPSLDKLTVLKNTDFSPHKIYITDNCIYSYFDGGIGKSKINNNFFEKKLNLVATTRNWKTTLKLQELSLLK